MMGPDVISIATDLESLRAIVARPPAALGVKSSSSSSAVLFPGRVTWEHRDEVPNWDYIYSGESSEKQAVKAAGGQIQVIDREWIIQVLVTGKLTN